HGQVVVAVQAIERTTARHLDGNVHRYARVRKALVQYAAKFAVLNRLQNCRLVPGHSGLLSANLLKLFELSRLPGARRENFARPTAPVLRHRQTAARRSCTTPLRCGPLQARPTDSCQ